jgi:hypothetical protein
VIKRIGTVISLIFVFSVGQAVLALNSINRAMNNEVTVAQENHNRREDRHDDMKKQWNKRKHRRHQMNRHNRRHRRHDQGENHNRN